MQSLKLTCVVLALTIILSVVQSKNITKGSGCYYKGSFHHGNWSDGCEFTCTCLNIDTGHYKCKTRCPVYHQLPHGCVLKLPIGEECCRQPDCSAVTVPYTIITGGNNGSYNKAPQTVITVTLVITEIITKIMKKITSVVIMKTIKMITIVIPELTGIIMEQKMETIIIQVT
ncbi:uncharacterized protein LOC132749086 isoform X2 [Ruditapes philippinarum]|nr:uncharacterized protein LOC132749086 isoform X2 [Ruditapes philippinarum]